MRVPSSLTSFQQMLNIRRMQIFKKKSSHYGYFKTITLTKSLPPTPSIELTEVSFA
jgi:hypothetical protein